MLNSLPATACAGLHENSPASGRRRIRPNGLIPRAGSSAGLRALAHAPNSRPVMAGRSAPCTDRRCVISERGRMRLHAFYLPEVLFKPRASTLPLTRSSRIIRKEFPRTRPCLKLRCGATRKLVSGQTAWAVQIAVVAEFNLRTPEFVACRRIGPDPPRGFRGSSRHAVAHA